MPVGEATAPGCAPPKERARRNTAGRCQGICVLEMWSSRVASFAATVTPSLLVLLLSSCSNEAPSSVAGGANAGGAAGAATTGGGGSGPAAGGSGPALGGAAGTSGSSAGLGGYGGAVGGGGAGGAGGASGGGGGFAGSSGSSGFALTSPDLIEGSEFADEHTCAAAGFNASLSPELAWTPGPSGTNSYAITFIDVTLTRAATPSDLGYHWVIYNIPATTLGLPGEFMDASSIGAEQNGAYLGPCPNFSGGSESHTYEFKIYALETATLDITPTSGTGAVKDAEAKLEASHLAVAKLSGTSDASPP